MFDFTIILLNGCFRSSVAATIDILESTEKLAQKMRLSAPKRRIWHCDEKSAKQLGVFTSTPIPKRISKSDHSIWVIPGLGLSDESSIHQRLSEQDALLAIKAIKKHHSHKGTLAASCSAVWLLQHAGALENKTATTSWILADALQSQSKNTNIDANKMICHDGNVITAGAAFAHIDLMLYLLQLKSGTSLTHALSKVLLLNQRDAQSPYIPSPVFSGENDLIQRFNQLVEDALPASPNVSYFAQQINMTERTLNRHIKSALGINPIKFIQTIRLQKARHLIETTQLSMESIAEKVGYQDASALRRLIKKEAGITPTQYRKN